MGECVAVYSLFGWLVLVVNDRKFLAETIFFSHTKPASSTFSRSSDEQVQPNEQAACFIVKRQFSINYLHTVGI